MNKDKDFIDAINKDKEWYRNNILNLKFWIINTLTLGTYGFVKMSEKMRLSGLV